MKRTGKIARLPYNTRQELNRRLLDNEPGDPLIAWLNAQPEVQTMLREQFEGNPITKQNLSEWRTGGFAIWELRQDVFGDALEAEEFSDELDAVTNGGLTDRLCTVLAGRYASLLVRWDGEVTPAFTQKLRALHILCRDLIILRREARSTGREAGKTQTQPAGGVATARRHMKSHTPKNAPESDPVAPGQTTLPPKSGRTSSGDVATSCRHPERETGKEEGGVKNEELGKRGQSRSVVPGRTTISPDFVTSALAELATSCRHPEPSGKPLPGMPNSILSKALKAARENQTPPGHGQPALAVLPDWDDVALVGQAVLSLGQK